MPDAAPAPLLEPVVATGWPRPAFGLLLDAGTLVLLGPTGGPPPASATATFPTLPHAAGRWRSASWALPAGGCATIAVLGAEGVLRAQAGGTTLTPAEGSRFALGDATRIELDSALLLDELQALGIELAAAFEFLRRALAAVAPAEPSRAVWKFLFGMMSAISRHDGFVEIIGAAEDGGLLLQGWSVHPLPAAIDMGVLAGSFETGQATIATFERPDLPKTARGLIAWVPRLAVEAAQVTRVHFRAGETYLHLDVVESRGLLGPAETLPHLRGLLGQLRGEAEALGALKRLCRPRFAGVDTVASLPQPVRAAIDLALHAEGAGLFLSGWILDPRRLITGVQVRSQRGFAGALDAGWVRLPRPDVSQGFAKDPLFASALRGGDPRHGFMAFVPHDGAIAADDSFYLDITLRDGSCAFAPLQVERPEPCAVLARLLGSVDVQDPAIDDIVGRHLGPFAAALAAARPGSEVPAALIPFGEAREAPKLTIVMPVPAGCADLDVNLAQLAGDPDAADAELVVVAPRAGGEPAAAALRRAAAFYGVGGRLALSETPLDAFDAMALGARHASAELLLFLSHAVLPRERGWLGRLRAAFARLPDAAALSPTLLYEDESIRFAGSAEPPDGDAIAALGRYAGYPRHWLRRQKPARAWAATMECALVSRRAFLECGGFARSLIGPELKNADFALTLRAAGKRVWWLPDVTLYACDDAHAGAAPEYWTRVRALVDRWAFRRRWDAGTDRGPR